MGLALNYNEAANKMRAAFEVKAKVFNHHAREAIRDVATWWVNTLLAGHFEYEAMAKYGLRPRSDKWNRRKNRGWIPPDDFYTRQNRKRGIDPARLWTRITPHPVGQERPLDARGQIKAHVLAGRQTFIANMSVPTTGRIRATVKIPVPHPINPKFKGEMVRTTFVEREQMKRMFAKRLRERLEAAGVKVKQGFGNARQGAIFPTATMMSAA